jgi:hypothetical protein
VEGNGRHTQLLGPSHRVVGREVNCPLPGPPGLMSSLGGEAASTWESSLAVLFVYTIQLKWFPAVVLYSAYIVQNNCWKPKLSKVRRNCSNCFCRLF